MLKRISFFSLITTTIVLFMNTSFSETRPQTRDNVVPQNSEQVYPPHVTNVNPEVTKQNLKSYQPRITRQSKFKAQNIPTMDFNQHTLSNNVLDNKGREFWVCFQQNYDDVGLLLKFFITSDVSTTATITCPVTEWSDTYAINANEITTVDLPSPANVVINSSEVIEQKGIHITAEHDITVYGLNQRPYSTDAYLALPVDILNVFYLVMSYTSISNTNNQSQFAVVSPYDNVTVTITPSCDTEGGQIAGESFSVILNQGDVYQVQANYGKDLTGSVIQSSLPVAVFAGHSCAFVPTDYAACDHLVEQLPPTNTWGSSFVTLPLENRENGDTFRILTSQDNTKVNINGEFAVTLNFGDFYETILDEPSHIVTTNPVLVMQFSNGNNWDPEIPNNGDPFMMLIPPSEQYMDSYTFSTPSAGFLTNYANVTPQTDGISSMELDGEAIDSELFESIDASDFSGAKLPIEIGSHNIRNTLGTPFGIYSYGFWDYDSYGYAGGLSLEYIYEGSAPIIVLTPETIQLNSQAQLDGTPLTISATITDPEEPFVQSANLFYRQAGDVLYTEIPMTNGTTDIWSAEIPGIDVQQPGIHYYIYAFDGQLGTTNPSINPIDNPYSIAVLPNRVPVIEHTPVTYALPGEDIKITAKITDATLNVESATMYYRIPGGNPVYNPMNMTLGTDDMYEATIPGIDVTTLGIEYYIEATDNLGFSGLDGSAEDPFLISVGEEVKVKLTMNVNPPDGGTTAPIIGDHFYDPGTVVDISATPETDYRFGNWIGDVADPNSATTTVTMDDDKEVTANFISQCTLSMSVNPVGGGSTEPTVGNHVYDLGSVVTIKAIATGGYRFVNWVGDVADRFSRTTTVQMDGNKTVTANYIKRCTLTIAVNPSGIATTNPPVGRYFYDEGEIVNISVTTAKDYRFINWTGGVVNANSMSTTVIMDDDKTVTANFILQCILTMSVNQPNWGMTNPSVGDHPYDLGVAVTLTAIPKTPRYSFLFWDGDVAQPNNATTYVIMDDDKNIQAYFFDSVPVELVSFSAKLLARKGGGYEILISWQTATETNNFGFEIERSSEIDTSSWEPLGFIDGQNTSTSPNHYTFVDNTVSTAGIYYYRLKQIDTNGAFKYSDEISITIQQPLSFNLSQNYPNPFNPVTTIAFDLPAKSDVTLVLINVIGDVVKVIAKGEYEAGHYEVELNVLDLPTGVYFYRIKASEFVNVKKLAVVK